MTFFNEDGTARTSTEASILNFLDTEVTREKGKFIPAIALYAVYIGSSGDDVSAKKFFRILAKHGYRSRSQLGGDFFENLTITEGATS